MSALEASWRCCATLSATKRRASILSSVVVASVVVNGGTFSNGSEGALGTAGGCARGDGEGGGRELVEAIAVGRSESGVLTSEGGVESSPKLRLARSELRKAVYMNDVNSSLFVAQAKHEKANMEA